MNDRMREVWTKLEAFEIDDLSQGAPELTFAERLARENRWSVGYARRVVEEYRKFVFLSQFAGHKVTPSHEVDQAWHLHITYTRSYWDRLCGQVLRAPLHHEPTRGGEREDAKFDDWYQKTRESYLRLFHHEPPLDIWPPSDVRFDPTQRWQRVDTSRWWMVPKRRTRRNLARSAAVVGAGLLVGGFTSNTSGLSKELGIGLLAAVGIFVFGVILAAISRHAKRSSKCKGSSTAIGGGGGDSGWWMWFGACGTAGGHHDGPCDGGAGGDSADGGGGGGADGGGSSGCGGGGCGGGGCGS